MSTTQTFITIFVITLIAFIIYTRIKKQDLKDTWEEIKELFGGGTDDKL